MQWYIPVASASKVEKGKIPFHFVEVLVVFDVLGPAPIKTDAKVLNKKIINN